MNAHALCACGKPLPMRRQKCDECRIEARRLSWRIAGYKKRGKPWTLDPMTGVWSVDLRCDAGDSA